MRFFFSVRTKETTHQELPEVPLRRSPGIASASAALPPLLGKPCGGPSAGEQISVNNGNATSDKLENGHGVSAIARSPTTAASSETKLKLVKKVDENQRVSDKKRVVYMVQNAADNGPQISAAAAYSLLPHESTAVGGNPSQLVNSADSVGGGGNKPAKTQQVQPTRTAEEATPRYRSLVEKENAKMKKLMQSLSEEKKLLKLRKREAMKEATMSPNTSLKMKITKSDSGLMVIQNSSVDEPKDVLGVIDSVANCDVNDENKKSLFLKAFELAPKKPSSEKEQKMVSRHISYFSVLQTLIARV